MIAFTVFGRYGTNIKNELIVEGNLAVANLEDAGEDIKKMDFVSASDNFAKAYEEFSKAGDNMNFMGAGISSLRWPCTRARCWQNIREIVLRRW